MNLIAAILLIGLSCLMLLQLRLADYFCQRTHAPSILVKLLFFFCYVKIILHYLIPAIFRLVNDFEFEISDRVSPWAVVRLYFFESISWAAYLVTLIMVWKIGFKFKNKLSDEQFIFRKIKFSKFFIWLSSLGFCAVTLGGALSFSESPLFVLSYPILFYCGLTSGPLLMLMAGKIFSRLAFPIGCFVSLLGSFAMGTRGAIVYMALFVVFIAWQIRRDPGIKKFILITSGALVASFLISGGMPSVPIKINDSGEISLDSQVSADKREGRSTLQEIDWRLGASTRLGTAFFNMYDRGEPAGINPIIHSLMGFLPRFINPDKPIPSTLEPDDIYSQGMYLIYREIYGYDSYSMSEFPTGAHFYWEFGVIGVLLLSMLSACYVGVSIRIFSNFGLASIPLTMALFKPWGYMDPKIWISDAILQIYQITIPFLIIYIIYNSNMYAKIKNFSR